MKSAVPSSETRVAPSRANTPLPQGRIVIVVSRYHSDLCDKLAAGALDTLAAAAAKVQIVRVPGAWELALATGKALASPDVMAAIALGIVIRGETSHDEHINRAVSMALMQLSLDSKKPVGFGLLTCNNLEQAVARSGGAVGNKGEEAAAAVLEMLQLLQVPF